MSVFVSAPIIMDAAERSYDQLKQSSIFSKSDSDTAEKFSDVINKVRAVESG